MNWFDKKGSDDDLNEYCQKEQNNEYSRKRKNFDRGQEADVNELKLKKNGDFERALSSSPLNLMWKLFKRRSQLNFHFCKDCSTRLFQNWRKNLSELENGGLRVSLELCPKCIQTNLQLSDLCTWSGENRKQDLKDK